MSALGWVVALVWAVASYPVGRLIGAVARNRDRQAPDGDELRGDELRGDELAPDEWVRTFAELERWRRGQL